jgi:hypothetical protein
MSGHPVFFSRGVKNMFRTIARSLARSLSVALTVVVTGSGLASAATIAWSTPTTISGPSDVSNVGGLVDSIMFSSNNANASTTVNGVTFARATNPSGNTETSAAELITTTQDADQYSNAAPTGNGNYDKLLSRESYTIPGNVYDIKLSGLTIGQYYSVQAWVDDSFATSNPGQNDLYLYGGDTQVSMVRVLTDGVLVPNGDYIIGHFTADATTETLAWGGNPNTTDPTFEYGTIDALQVRAVPEPSSLIALGGLGAVGLLWAARRRRKSLGGVAPMSNA